MKYRVNIKSLERLKSLIRSGTYVDRAWSFSAADSNALLGDPQNWTTYSLWFLGIGQEVPDSISENGATDQTPHKDWYSFPFGKNDQANLQALREIVSEAKKWGEYDIAKVAQDCLDLAAEREADHKTASGASCDKDISFRVPVKIKAGAGGKKQATFDADAYTGAAMTLEGWTHPVVIDIDGFDPTEKSRPALRDHDQKRPVGHTTSILAKDGKIVIAGVLSAANADSQELIDSSRGDDPFPWQISVGAKTAKNQFVPEGQSAMANGRSWDGPVNIARKTVAQEFSFLTLGADDNTSARIAAQAAKGSPMKMKKKFAAWAKARNITMSDMENDQMCKAAKDMYKAQMKCEADDESDEDYDDKDEKDNKDKDSKSGAVAGNIQAAAAGAGASQGSSADLVADTRRIAAEEFKRQRSITAMLRKYEKQMEYSDDAQTKYEDIAAKVIGGELDPRDGELELIKAARPDVKNIMVNSGKGSGLNGGIIAAAAAVSMGVGEKAAYEGLGEQNANMASGMKGMSLHKIIAHSANAMGLHCAPGSIDDEFLREFLPRDKAAHRDQVRAQASKGIRASAGGAFATMTLSGITENILNKAMLEMYTMQAVVREQFCYQRDVNDFKIFKVYRLTASGDLLPVGPTGEIKNISLQDESYQNQVTTKAALMPLMREIIINDDTGALTQTAQILGRKSTLNLEKACFTTLLSGLTTAAPGASTGKTANNFNFWSAGASNYQSGAGSAFSLTSVQKAEQQFLQQTDANGDPIMVMPDRLLVGPENKVPATNLYNGASVVVSALGSTSAKTLDPNYNALAGNFKPVVSPYLGGASTVTGHSSTQWLLLGDPAGGFAPVQIGFLRGQRSPIIRQVDVDSIILGVGYQVIFDFGVALLDYRCGQYSAGA